MVNVNCDYRLGFMKCFLAIILMNCGSRLWFMKCFVAIMLARYSYCGYT